MYLTVLERRSGDTSGGHGRLPTDVSAAERLGYLIPFLVDLRRGRRYPKHSVTVIMST